MLYNQEDKVYVTKCTHGHRLSIGKIYPIRDVGDDNYGIIGEDGVIWRITDDEIEPAGAVGDSAVIIESPNISRHCFEVGTRVMVHEAYESGGMKITDSDGTMQAINREDVSIVITRQNQEDMYTVGEIVKIIAGHDNHHSFTLGESVKITLVRSGGGVQAENINGYSQSLYGSHFERIANITEVDGVEKFDRFKKNLSKQGNLIISYGTIVAKVDGDKLFEVGKYSATTTKHVRYVAKELRLELVEFGTVVEVVEEPAVDKKREMVLTAHRYASHNKQKIKADFADYFKIVTKPKLADSDLRYHPRGWSYLEQKGRKVMKILIADEDRHMDDGSRFATQGRMYPRFKDGELYTDNCNSHQVSGVAEEEWLGENFREANDDEINRYLQEEYRNVCGGAGYQFIGRDKETMQTVIESNVCGYKNTDDALWFKAPTDIHETGLGGIIYEDGKWFDLENSKVEEEVLDF